MALKILLADPDIEWLKAAKAYFEENFYTTVCVANGKDAQRVLSSDKFFALIMNSTLQEFTATQVLAFLKRTNPSLNVLMTTDVDETRDLDEQLTPERLKKLGATEVLVRPYEFKDLKVQLEGHQSLGQMVSSIPKREGASEEVEVQLKDDEFTSIKIEEFYSSKSVLFDIFIKLNSGRYIKILHAGDTFSKERVDSYKNDKKMEYLYFQKKDIFRYVKYNSFVSKKLVGSRDIDSTTKVNILKNVAAKFVESAFLDGVKPQIVDQGKEVAESMYRLVKSSDDLFKTLVAYSDFDPSAFTHAYLVTLFSTAIIKQFEWESKTTIECTALACLFHDIGKMTLPRELLNMKVEDMSPEQYAQYKTHPQRGVELVDGNPLINISVKQIILQHHENFDGTGFPFGTRSANLLTLANIVHLADDLVHIIQEQEKKPADALKVLLSSKDGVKKYNSVIIEALLKTFVDPVKLKKMDDKKSHAVFGPSKKVS